MDIVSFINSEGFALGAMGAFVFEMVWLRTELESKRNKKIIVIALLPVWVLTGSIVGGVVGMEVDTPIYVFLAGGIWRKIVENSGKFTSSFVKAVSETAAKEGL